MKVIYISTPHFLDTSLPLIKELYKDVDLFFVLDISPYNINSGIFKIPKQYQKAGIYNFRNYPVKISEKLNKYIDFSKSYIVNRTSKKSYHFTNLKLQFQFNRFINKMKPDIIHFIGSININYLFIIFKYDLPLVVTVHDPFSHSGEGSGRREFFKKLTYNNAKQIIILNKNNIKEFSFYYKISEDRINYIPFGILDIFKDFIEEYVPEESNHILFFGRISPYKGIEYLIEASKIVRKLIPDLKVTIAGNGKYWFNIETIKNNTTFNVINRYIPNEELVELIQMARIIVCPYTDVTQSGVIMTALAFNKPIIATSVGGIPEVINNNVTGILISPKNSQALANAIIDLLSSPQKVKKIRKNIEDEKKHGKFSWPNIANKTIEVYNKVIQNDNSL